MKKSISKNKKYLLILVIIIILGISLFYIFNNFIKNKNSFISNENYTFSYNTTWRIISETDTEIKLVHKKSDSIVDIQINELHEDLLYKSLDEIFDSLLYNIQNQNEDYKLINKETTKLTKEKLDGYKILFEKDDENMAVYFYRKGDKLVTTTYQATLKYFDILLENINTFIDNFNVTEEKFDVMSKINLSIRNIEFSNQSEISNALRDNREEKIADKNYMVKYLIPSNFKSKDYNTIYNFFEFENTPNGTNIDLTVNILNTNLYEYLDKENTLNIYQNNQNSTNEALNKLNDNPLSYIYKFDYTGYNDSHNEDIEIVSELNKNHIIVFSIKSEGIGIPKELVDSIKIIKIENIASNIEIQKEDGFLIGKLKQYTDYTYTQTEEISLKIPEEYKEIDDGYNLFERRKYVYNFDKEKEIYKNEVIYETISYSIEDEIDLLSKSIDKENGKFQEIINLEDLMINNKKFKIFQYGQTKSSDAFDNNGDKLKYYENNKILFYELQNNNYLVIIIKANDCDITNEMILQLTNFEVENS